MKKVKLVIASALLSSLQLLFFSCSNPSSSNDLQSVLPNVEQYSSRETILDSSIQEKENVDFSEDFAKLEGSSVVGSDSYKHPLLGSEKAEYRGVFILGRNLNIADFWISDHEVTQKEYFDVMSVNPSFFQGKKYLPEDGEKQENRPVEWVSWYDALVYCNVRSEKEGFSPCYFINGSSDTSTWGDIPEISNESWDSVECDFQANGYRLPTEVEWEYAARNGSSMDVTVYPGSNDIDEISWYIRNANGKTHEVKQKKPNSLGLYDMAGNVWEWCWDWRDNVITAETPITGEKDGQISRTYRGGSWYNEAVYCTVAYRGHVFENYKKYKNLGIRVVRTVTD